MTTTAAAPSLSGQALPAVIRPSGRKTGLSCASFSSVVSGRGPSSFDTTVPSGRVTGVISRSKNPFSTLATARFCDSTPNSSISRRRDVLELGDVLGRLAHSDVDVGKADRGRPWSLPALGALGRPRLGVGEQLVVGAGNAVRPSRSKRLTVSTPAATNTSPSPARIACAAIRIVWSDEEQ